MPCLLVTRPSACLVAAMPALSSCPTDACQPACHHHGPAKLAASMELLGQCPHGRRECYALHCIVRSCLLLQAQRAEAGHLRLLLQAVKPGAAVQLLTVRALLHQQLPAWHTHVSALNTYICQCESVQDLAV